MKDELSEAYQAPSSEPAKGHLDLETGSAEVMERRVSGRLVRRKGSELVVEIEIADWQPSTDVTVEWDDGTRSDAKIDEGRSTRPGYYTPGQIVRLTLLLASEPAVGKTPLRILLGDLTIELG